MNFKVGILIPTMNRYDFIIKQLDFYLKVKCEHTVYIGDSSDLTTSNLIQEKIIKYKGLLSVRYFHLPNFNERQAINFLAENTKEDYCAFIGDDDFFIPNSLSKCAKFLFNNIDYRTAQGRAIIFSKNSKGKINSCSYWNAETLLFEADDCSARALNLSKMYWVPQFSVHRTNEFIYDSLLYKDIMDKSFGELIHSYAFILGGKSKFLDCLYLIRQDHESRYFLPTLIDWFSNPNWIESFKTFKEFIVCQLIKVKMSTTTTEALIEFDKIFGVYIAEAFKRSYNPNKISRFRLLHILNFLLIKIIKKREISFSQILKNKSSKYYNDTKIIYEHINY